MRTMPTTLREASWFIWRHYPPAKDWGRDLLWKWVGWHARLSTLAMVRDYHGQIVGLGIARPVMSAEDGANDDKAFDPEGPVVYVDLLISRHRDVFKALALEVRRRFGMRKILAYKRHAHNPNPTVRIRDYAAIRHVVLRKDLQNVVT